jgi:hypothetical protein
VTWRGIHIAPSSRWCAFFFILIKERQSEDTSILGKPKITHRSLILLDHPHSHQRPPDMPLFGKKSNKENVNNQV